MSPWKLNIYGPSLKPVSFSDASYLSPESKIPVPTFLGGLIKKLLPSTTKSKIYVKKVNRSTPTVHNMLQLKSLEISLYESCVEAKRNYEKTLVADYAFKRNNNIFSYIRSISKQSSIPPVMHLDHKEASEDHDIVSLFNEFFNSVFTIPQFVQHLPFTVDSPAILVDIEFSVDDVFRNLSILDVSKAMGIDGIPNYVLKSCATSLCEPLYHLFKLCISQSYLPVEWRTHKVMPIHKSGDKMKIKNYRPISLLCCASKILEAIVFNKVYDHIAPLIFDQQFGFLRNRSTVQKLLIFQYEIVTAFKNKSQFDAIYFDIRKAFDTVDHSILLSKLSDQFSICGKALLFFTAYLSSRLQCVSINKHSSSLLPVSSGVLGPILFLLYINDMPKSVKNTCLLLFTDDTSCSKPVFDPNIDCSLLQQDIDHIFNWTHDNHLSLHEEKTLHIRFHRTGQAPITSTNYHVNNCGVIQKSKCKDLGVIFTENLSWSDHIDYILSKAYRTLFLLKLTFSTSSSISVKKNLYLSTVLPIVTYGSCVWRSSKLRDIIALEKLQRRATKFILNYPKMDCKSCLLRLNMLPLMYRYKIYDIMFFVNSIKYLQPDQTNTTHFNILNYVSFTTTNNRSATTHKLKHPAPTSNLQRHSYFYRLPRLWNSLPPINFETTPSCIKSQVYSHLIPHFISHFVSENPCSYHSSCPCNLCLLI